ncbi:MAG: ParB/RepB/Spo0J family partition protein [Saprospiraceae bacterium]
MTKKDELHKGLKSLLKDIENKSNTEKSDVVKKLSNTIAMIAVEKIEFNPFQPRNVFRDDELQELADSIKTLGLIQPVTVRSMGGEKYQLISGERRIRACKLAGLKEVPAYIRIADDQSMMEMALVENIQRSDLNSLEIAIAYQRLIDECSLTHDKVAERVGKNRSTVTNYLRLLKLPPTIQNGIKNELISMGHARALAGITDPILQISLFNDTLSNDLSVRALESKINSPSKSSSKNTTEGNNHDANVMDIKKKLQDFFDSKIELKRNSTGKGSIKIDFKNDDELNDILEKLDLI